MSTVQAQRQGFDAGRGAPPPSDAPERLSAGRGGILPLAAVTAGAGMALVTGVEGSWGWALLRVALVGSLIAAVVAFARTGSPSARGLVFAAVGLVTTTAGGAIGVPFLAKSGWSVRASGALIAGVAGLVLLIVGSALAISSLRGWRRLAAVPVALFAAYALGSPVAIAVYATNVPRPSLGSRTPANYGLDYTDATFLTADGIRLSGWYIASSNRAAVALLHGASSTRSNVLEEAVVLARQGYGVLLFDARGFGRSGGRAMNFGWWGDDDVTAAVSYLQGRPDVDPDRIAAVGSSMGGEEAIGAMAADARIRAVVAEGATGRVAGDLGWLSEHYGIRGVVQEAVSRLMYTLTDVLTAAAPPTTLRSAAAAAAPRPVLLVAAGKVEEETYAATAIREAAPSNVDIWVVPGSAHAAGLQAQPAEWERRVTGFLDAALRARQ